MKIGDIYDGTFPELVGDPFKMVMFNYLLDKDIQNLSSACRQTRYWATKEIEKRVLHKLLLAVVQGNETQAKRVLESDPDLLYSKNGVAIDYSGRTIQGLTPFQAALCAGDVEMCEMMKEQGFTKLENGEVELKKQFVETFTIDLEAYVQVQQENVFGFDDIVQAIINTPAEQVTAALNKEFNNDLPLHRALDTFRKAFTEKSQSERVFNPYHLLRAFETYDAHLSDLGDWNKRDLFWRQVIGYVQRYLPACYGQAFAQGLFNIVNDKEPLNRSFKFRYSRDGWGWAFSSGLGLDYAAWAGVGTERLWAGRAPGTLPALFQNYVEQKHRGLEKLLSQRQCSRSRAQNGV